MVGHSDEHCRKKEGKKAKDPETSQNNTKKRGDPKIMEKKWKNLRKRIKR